MSLQALDEIQAFRDARAAGIGATDAPAILGQSPWASPFDVYLSKVEPPEVEAEPSLPMWLGQQIQGTVAELYSLRTGVKLRAAKKQRVHPAFSWQRCHLDFLEWGNPKHLVECKTTSVWDDWGKQGSLKVPVHYWIQCQHEMAVTGATLTTLAVLFGLRDFRYYDIERDDQFIEKMTAYENEFWHDHVVPRVPPPIDGSAGARRYLRRQNPTDNGLVRPATPEQNSLAERYRMARHNFAATAEALATVEHQLIDVIGDAAGLSGTDFKITYKKSKDYDRVGWQQAFLFLARLLEDAPPEALAPVFKKAGLADMPVDQVVKAATGLYTTKVEGSRRFDWRDYRSEVEP